MAGYTPKYPKILIDNSSNYPNATGIRKEITVEEWQDIMHHNHTSIEENKTDISLLKKKIDSIFKTGNRFKRCRLQYYTI